MGRMARRSNRSGPAHVHASLSPRQAAAMGLVTINTSGPRGSGSSASAALSRSLGSRLQARTARLGSTLYRLHWRHMATPSGRWISRLRASVVRTSDSASGGWPTDGWPTPMASTNTHSEKAKHGRPTSGPHRGGCNLGLEDAARLAGWPTPRAQSQGRERDGNEGRGTGPSDSSWMGDAAGEGLLSAAHGRVRGSEESTGPRHAEPERSGDADRLGDAEPSRLSDAGPSQLPGEGRRSEGGEPQPSGRPANPWRELEWIACRDGRSRPTQSGLFPLAPRHPGDVARLRAYGNAISPVVAAEVIAAWMDLDPS